ncbi:MAG: NAD(P)/FAD-dependent oxidoreductase [Candidatus Omnitrophota bacterium]
MKKFSTVIIGGGASGIVAAISAKRKGKDVLICEKTAKLGKKISISGSGRCNLSNDDLSERHYNPSARKLVKSVFSKFGGEDIKNFFRGLGLVTYSEGGRIFPITNQSASVLAVLEKEMKRLGVSVEFNFAASEIVNSKQGLLIKSKDNKRVLCDSAVITGGGMTYPVTGSDGASYGLARQLGHSIIEPVPSAVALVVKDRFCHFLQGQKIFAGVKAIIDGNPAGEASGELLFTRYGLSGTVILDISREVSVEINRRGGKQADIIVDMAPFMDLDALREEFRKNTRNGAAKEDLIVGILPNKFSLALKEAFGGFDVNSLADRLKSKRFRVIGTRGWNEAEFTAGGVNLSEVNCETLESRLKKGVYFAGEVLDVDGERGGYNLAWAWASGFLAGVG